MWKNGFSFLWKKGGWSKEGEYVDKGQKRFQYDLFIFFKKELNTQKYISPTDNTLYELVNYVFKDVRIILMSTSTLYIIKHYF